MSAGRDFLLFILFLIALGVVWFLTGGPTRTISHTGWFLSGNEISIPSVNLPTTTPASSAGKAGSATGQNQSSQNSASQKPQISAWEYFFNYRPGLGEIPTPPTSPYAGTIRIQQGQANATDPAKEYVIIQTSQELKTPLTITGWTLQNTDGIRASIGNAAEVASLGMVNSQTPITIGPGSIVYVTTGRSPNGTSFRVNECSGYFGQFQSFTPILQQQCPYPYDEMFRYPQTLSNNEICRQYVDSLTRCDIYPNATRVPNIGAACQDFVLNVLSYNGCITNHQKDPGFYRAEWRVYLNRDQQFWKNAHEIIRLLDENGNLVAQSSY